MSLRLKPSLAIMAPSFLRFQTKELRIWTIQRNTESDEKPGSIQYMENRFRSAGIGESEIVYMHVYPNRWALSKIIENNGGCRYYEIIKVIEINEIIAYIKPIHATYRIFAFDVKL